MHKARIGDWCLQKQDDGSVYALQKTGNVIYTPWGMTVDKQNDMTGSNSWFGKAEKISGPPVKMKKKVRRTP